MSATIPASSGSWSKQNDGVGRGAALDDHAWIERLVRLEERLSALTARVDKLEGKPDDHSEIIDILTEIGELLEEKVSANGAGDTLADEITRAPGAIHHVLRRSVFAVFAVVLFIISKLLEPGGAGITFKVGG